MHGPPKAVIDAMPEPEARQKMVEKMLQIKPMDLRTLDIATDPSE
jgi:hypothetical protein